MISSVHHIALIVSSEQCLEFYKLLGFQEYYRIVRKSDVVVLLQGNDVILEVFIDPNHPQRKAAGETEPTGLRHFALRVEGPIEDELIRLKNESREELITSQIMKDWQGSRFVHINDYDGNVVELHE